jgi:predicted DNA binding CopG/RHH family protein
MAKDTSAPDIWRKIIDKLNKAGLSYVLVGGAALVIHGLPRSTLDIDIYVPAKEGVLNKLFEIADSLNLRSQQRTILAISGSPDLFTDQWICFSYLGQDILDVFLSGEKEFKKLYAGSEQKGDKAITVRVASLDDIKAMKRRTGRPVDLADLKYIRDAAKYK